VQRLLALGAYRRAARVGIYVHCAALREVDSGGALAAALAAGKRLYVPLVDDRASNMSLLHLDAPGGLVAAPPFGILEPTRTYAAGGGPREDGEPFARERERAAACAGASSG